MKDDTKRRYFQDIILGLQNYWAEYGCVILQPYNSEVGAGTFNPATFLRCLGPEPWKTAYVEPSRRPKDGRYGENPIRMQQFLQYQVLLKPAPSDVLDVYFRSLESLGIDLRKHDVRLVEDDWESPTLGAAGLGWEVWIDGMEITQFTYFQQAGGMELPVTSSEITYGLGRLATFIQGVDSFFELEWAPGVSFGELQRGFEVEFSRFNFEAADIPHAFNVLDARGAISVTERTGYIARVRKLARKAALLYTAQREELGHPLLPGGEHAENGSSSRGPDSPEVSKGGGS